MKTQRRDMRNHRVLGIIEEYTMYLDKKKKKKGEEIMNTDIIRKEGIHVIEVKKVYTYDSSKENNPK